MATHDEVLKSMELADYIVVLQNAAIQSIPEHLRSKTRVIYQSVRSITRKPLAKRSFVVSVIGHLRPEKDPFCITRSLTYLKPDSTIRIKHLGKAMTPDMAKIALANKTQSNRYQWLGEKSHGQTLQLLSRSHLLVISSLMEGGAHVVSEAISLGVPVIASDIPGNRGLLGEHYPGYYPVQNHKELAALLEKAETNPRFYYSLEKHIQSRRKLVNPNLELRSIQTLLDHALA
jgi:glycosyltransferase involved in cell wall biosynthesis